MPRPWDTEGLELAQAAIVAAAPLTKTDFGWERTEGYHDDYGYRPWLVLPQYWALNTRKCAWRKLKPLQCDFLNNDGMCVHEKDLPEKVGEDAGLDVPDIQTHLQTYKDENSRLLKEVAELKFELAKQTEAVLLQIQLAQKLAAEVQVAK